VAERDDAAIAEDQLERQREQDHDQDVGAQRQVLGAKKRQRCGRYPGQHFEAAAAAPSRRSRSPRPSRLNISGRLVRAGLAGATAAAPWWPRRRKKAPNCGIQYLHAVSPTPISSAPTNGPRSVPSPPIATTMRK
jgi:hypothetical protein